MEKNIECQTIKKRCMKCLNDRVKVTNVSEKDLNEKFVYVLYTTCPKCGAQDSELAPEDLMYKSDL